MKSIRRNTVGRGVSALLAIPVLFATAFASSRAIAPAPAEIISTRYSSMGPMKVAGVSISNLGVVDGHLFRGAQPKGDDFAALKGLGINTIIDLRDDAKKESRKLAEAAGLNYVNIPIDGHGSPTDADAAAFVKAVDDPANGVVYAHCAGGRHRTGSMVAIYRMVKDGWTIDQAYDEMEAYDFYTSNGHGGFKTFVYDYYNRMTADASSVPVAYQPLVASN